MRGLPLAVLGFLTSTGLAACGGGDDDDGASPDGGDDVDAGPGSHGLTGCGPGAAADVRAMVVLVNGDEDAIEVLSLDGSDLVDHGLRFTGIDNPRAVAIRDDGAEALIGWGGFGNPYGIVTVTMAPDGSSATIGEPLVLGDDRTPFAIAYGGDDLGALAVASSEADEVIAFERSGDVFVEGAHAPVPDDYPLELLRRPGREEIVISRAYLLSDPATDLYLLSRDGDGAWQTLGSPGAMAPNLLDVAMGHGGDAMFAASHDPADPLSASNLDAGGLLHIIPLGNTGFGDEVVTPIPGPGVHIAVAPGGEFLALDRAIYHAEGGPPTPVARSRTIYTVPLVDGVPGPATEPIEEFADLLIDSFEIAPSGHLLTTLVLYGDQAPAEEQHPLYVWAQPNLGAWTRCTTRFVDGAGEIAIAP